jgi:hypothetical protein
MNRAFITILLFVTFSLGARSQHFLGLYKEEITAAMKTDYGDFIYQTGTVNTSFKYMKYVDMLDQRTILFFLNDGDTCNVIKFMLDYDYLDKYRTYYNEHFRMLEKDVWVDDGVRVPTRIKMKEEKWYFSLVLEPYRIEE